LMTESPFEPLDPDWFARDIASRINTLMADPALRARMARRLRRDDARWRRLWRGLRRRAQVRLLPGEPR